MWATSLDKVEVRLRPLHCVQGSAQLRNLAWFGVLFKTRCIRQPTGLSLSVPSKAQQFGSCWVRAIYLSHKDGLYYKVITSAPEGGPLQLPLHGPLHWTRGARWCIHIFNLTLSHTLFTKWTINPHLNGLIASNTWATWISVCYPYMYILSILFTNLSKSFYSSTSSLSFSF